MNDFKFAFRQLLKNPGSTLMAVLILALGIGGTAAVFSVADKVLLNPIPGRNSDRLVTLQEVDVMHDSHWHVSPPLIEELATHSDLIESLTYCSQGPEEKKFRAVEMAKQRLRKHGKTIEVDGVRVIVDGGWGLVRASNTQPLLVLRWEANSEQRLREIQRLIEGTVQEIRKELA